MVDAFRRVLTTPKQLRLVAWEPPDLGVVKINTDGASLGNPGVAGAGGLLRDGTGKWLVGFRAHLGSNMVSWQQFVSVCC